MAQTIPWEIRVTLRAGTVYYFQDRGLKSAEPHFFIVVNSRPLEQQVLLLTVVTSNVDRVKRFRGDLPGTTVELDPRAYDELKVLSIVDCNVVFIRTLADLVDRIRWKRVRHHKDLPKDLLKAIQNGVKASPLVDAATKKLID